MKFLVAVLFLAVTIVPISISSANAEEEIRYFPINKQLFKISNAPQKRYLGQAMSDVYWMEFPQCRQTKILIFGEIDTHIIFSVSCIDKGNGVIKEKKLVKN